jgi:hypothetical protein
LFILSTFYPNLININTSNFSHVRLLPVSSIIICSAGEGTNTDRGCSTTHVVAGGGGGGAAEAAGAMWATGEGTEKWGEIMKL